MKNIQAPRSFHIMETKFMLKEKTGWVVSLIHSSKTVTFSDRHCAFGGIQTVLLLSHPFTAWRQEYISSPRHNHGPCFMQGTQDNVLKTIFKAVHLT